MHRKETLNSQNTKNNTWKDAIIKKRSLRPKKIKTLLQSTINCESMHNADMYSVFPASFSFLCNCNTIYLYIVEKMVNVP
jgi:hypothetical protein